MPQPSPARRVLVAVCTIATLALSIAAAAPPSGTVDAQARAASCLGRQPPAPTGNVNGPPDPLRGAMGPPALDSAASAPDSGVARDWVSLAPGAAPPDNPLKGFVAYPGDYTPPRGTGFPHSLENLYFPLCAVMQGLDRFAWERLDAALNAIANRGHQTILRVYLDYPTLQPGVPRYLLDSGLNCRYYDDQENDGTSCSPNYEDPNLRQALRSFIRAFGQRYDGDARIGFIQLGLLGYWGEWHTFPSNNRFASPSVQEEVLQAYVEAFPTTRLLARYPQANTASRPLGYHDDSFLYTTTCPLAFCFETQMREQEVLDKWRTQPIGGEIRPGDPNVQACLWNDPPCRGTADRGGGPIDYSAAIRAMHVSWLWNQVVFSGRGATITPNNPQYARAVEGARQLGYTLQVAEVSLPNVRADGPFQVAIRMQNAGVAPFYYAWPVELGVLDGRGQIVSTWQTDWALPRVIPGEAPTELAYTRPSAGLPPGTYKLLLRAANPLSAPPYNVAAARPLRFANQAQDADQPGWLTLGSFTVSG